MPKTFELKPEEAAMLARAFAVFAASPSTLIFNGKQQAIAELNGLPPTAQLVLPDCKAFVVPD